MFNPKKKLVALNLCILFLSLGCKDGTPKTGKTKKLSREEILIKQREEARREYRKLKEFLRSIGDDEMAEAVPDEMPDVKPLPNYQTGPLRPYPDYLNFYEIESFYSGYLLCNYFIREKKYDSSKEPEYFLESLKQIRDLGPKEFPPIKWIAVIIVNKAEHHGASTFEKSHKVGAIFEASKVFDSSVNLSHLISNAKFDYHPFKYDSKGKNPMEQQRWLIVEKHMKKNKANKGSDKKNCKQKKKQEISK